jgi:CRISPR-associated protein Cas10/Cmr2 subtype III-B
MSQSLLKLQIGPVQDFIAQARSTRDLWSGSYLLSWLMARALRKIVDQCGEDSVIFPAVDRQPLIQWLSNPVKDPYNAAEILTPSLPNFFFIKIIL